LGQRGDNQQKSGVRKQSLKKERLRFCGKESEGTRGKAIEQSRAEEERYESSKTNNNILFGNAGPAVGQTT
jgi:hypothetical protein